MSGYRRPRRTSAKKPRQECISKDEREDSDQSSVDYPRKCKKGEKVFRPTADLSLSSLREAVMLIRTYKPSKSMTRKIVEDSCQTAAAKHVIEESYQITLLYIEHNTFSYMKEIFLQSILKADFLTGVQVLCSMLETENVSLLLHSTYFKKAALLIYMYSENVSFLKEFLKFSHRSRNKYSDQELVKVLKKYLKLKPHKSLVEAL